MRKAKKTVHLFRYMCEKRRKERPKQTDRQRQSDRKKEIKKNLNC